MHTSSLAALYSRSLCRYEAFDVVKHFHEKNKCQMAGIVKDVQNNSHGITKEMVQLFIPLCAKCTQNKAVSVSPLPPPSRVIRPPPSKCTSVPARAALASSQKKKPKATENPIVSDFFGHTYNLDLADMRSEPDSVSLPDRTFNWFGALSDHLTGHLIAVSPLSNKARARARVRTEQSRANTVARANNVSLNIARDQSSAEVAMGILPGFGAFGAPLILIHDNGKEFKGDFQEDINKYWTSSKVRFTDVHESEENAHSSDGARYSSFVQMIKYSCKNL